MSLTIPLFHYSLVKQGILLLGNAETIGGFPHLFHLINNKTRIYQRIEHLLPINEIDFPAKYFPVASEAQDVDSRPNPIANLETLADQLLLQHFSPAAVLTRASTVRHRHRLGLPATASRCAGGVAYPDIHGKTGQSQPWALVQGAYHALSHPGQLD